MTEKNRDKVFHSTSKRLDFLADQLKSVIIRLDKLEQSVLGLTRKYSDEELTEARSKESTLVEVEKEAREKSPNEIEGRKIKG